LNGYVYVKCRDESVYENEIRIEMKWIVQNCPFQNCIK
jgi:hypothetical protein